MFFRGLEWFHDVPDPSGIIFGPGIAGNDGLRVSFDQFSTVLDRSSPQFPNSFRKSRSHVSSQAKPRVAVAVAEAVAVAVTEAVAEADQSIHDPSIHP